MSFLKRVFRRGCSHRFTWPRLDDNGRHYQVCLTCGAKYEYDWDRMRLTGRLLGIEGPVPLASGQTTSPARVG